MSSSRLDRAVQAWKRLWKSNAIQDDHPQSDQQTSQSDNRNNNKTRNNKKSRNTRNNKKSRNPIKSKKSRNPINNKKASGTKSQKKYNQKRNKNSKSNNTDFLRYQQQDLHNHNLTKEDVEVFGDTLILPKPEHTFWIISQNIHNLPELPLTLKPRQCINLFLEIASGHFCNARSGPMSLQVTTRESLAQTNIWATWINIICLLV